MRQVTNSIDQTARVEATDGKMGTIDIAPLIAESIRRTHNGWVPAMRSTAMALRLIISQPSRSESISALFRADPLYV